jgi:hypothetical protein
MKRRAFLAGLAGAAIAASPALAQDFVDDIIGQLKKQGFRSVVTERTLLGRVRILADRKDGQREIIVNPRTGEILRDLWTAFAGGKSTVDIVRDGSGGGGSGGHGGHGGGDDDDDDDEDEDEDEGEDHSGHGGGGGD